MKWNIKSLITLFFLLQLSFVFGQQNQQNRKEKKEQINAARVGYITQQIHLTEEQSTKFWPIYNEYSEKRRSIKKELKKSLKDKDLANIQEEDAKKLLDNIKSLKDQERLLNEEYEPKLLQVISYKQLVQLIKAEREFIKMLHNKASGNYGEGHPREDF